MKFRTGDTVIIISTGEVCKINDVYQNGVIVLKCTNRYMALEPSEIEHLDTCFYKDLLLLE